MKPSKEQLEKLYCEQKQSPENIAKIYGVIGRTIRSWMTDYGIARLGPAHLRKGKSAIWNIGLIRTPAQREKNRIGHLGRIPSNFGKGRKKFQCAVCDTEVFDKPYRKKHTCSTKCRDEFMHMQRGVTHWNFKGENAGFRQRQRNWAQYKEWRKLVLKKADYRCGRCNKPGGRLTAHHLYNWSKHAAQRFEPSNGVCLCWKCHWDFHKTYGHHYTTPEMFSEWLTT